MPDWLPFRSATFVITGGMEPMDVGNGDYLTRCLTSYFLSFHHIELKTVIRGTLSIINEWQRFFRDGFITVGHNVQGSPVERYSVKNEDESGLRTIVVQIISRFLNVPDCNMSSDCRFVFKPHNIAILLNLDLQKPFEYGEEIKEHLRNNGFPCGDIKEQIDYRNLIAVDTYFYANSFDWPVVFVIRKKTKSGFIYSKVMAYSRCISKLIIIEID
jgi:hypothetical protein